MTGDRRLLAPPWCCRRHDQAAGQPASARPARQDFREPGRAVGRFRESGLMPGYGEASGLHCWLFSTAAVFALDRATAEAYADAHHLRGPS